ncbi:phage shock protein C [Ligilactobacillus salitolerans]|uniref:Phage shock protein C n=1 Tax=Ligilactobacillus salitolerans TaxID=1808352 RepID=A0A401IT30_9LACO|nr:PspC domain-containing protein [Ligilactobacillus salitolerans]GBG94703.1 phage shock protein C [Ligilactobacillus salitolerans]
MKEKKKLTKSREKVVSGVFGGLAEYFDWDKTIVRLIGAVLIIFPGNVIGGLLLYWLAAIIMPDQPYDDHDHHDHDDDSVLEGEFKEKD